RAGESRDRDVWIVHPELPDDVGLNMRGSRGSKREDRWTAESPGDCSEREVVRAEIVPPLAHTVRLIDDEETDRAREKMLEKRAILETLGGEVKYFSLA